jgi:electron transfer flavoprotein alpha subunit
MKILLIAEHDHQKLKPATYHCVTAAKELGNEIEILVMGEKCENITAQAALLPHIQRILVADDSQYTHQLAENCASLVADIGKNYDYILTNATTFGKNLLPRVAALLDVAMVSDVMQIVSADTFVRPIYAGNVLATVQSSDKIKIMTIRPTAFVASSTGTKSAENIEKIHLQIVNTLSKFENQILTRSSRPELTAARVIIAGGRGLKSAENFQLLDALADQLGAAIGASRAAVDAGFAPNDYQVGQTGKVVAPDLYIAIGISGAIQHLAGMKDSKVIVAINKDPDAPIFQVADYGLVGDLFDILPQLRLELDKILS